MCSIFGALGFPDMNLFSHMAESARDRGRDGGRMETYELVDGREIILGNWRATPTPELETGPNVRLQPYDGIVHNGTISNDKELGGREDEIDSEVLPRVINRRSVYTIAHSLMKVKGSYALGIRGTNTLFLAANYKPLYYYATGDDNDTIYFSSMERHLSPIVRRGHRAVRLEPYSVINLSNYESYAIPRDDGMTAVVIASAGLDSTVAATHLIHQGYDVMLLHFAYGCNAQGREIDSVREIARVLGCRYKILDLPFANMQGDSPLFSPENRVASGVEGAEFAHEWVPARNLVMIGMAVAYAEANGYHTVALGNNLEEAGAYPDNEEEFTNLLNQVMPYATQNGYKVSVVSPVGTLMKHEIVKLGLQIGAPLEHTWSCYKGGEKHCGECGPCFMRREAFRRNGVVDPVM